MKEIYFKPKHLTMCKCRYCVCHVPSTWGFNTYICQYKTTIYCFARFRNVNTSIVQLRYYSV